MRGTQLNQQTTGLEELTAQLGSPSALLVRDLGVYGAQARGSTLPADLQERILALFPELQATTSTGDPTRLEHIFRVIHRFAQIVSGNFQALYDDLPESDRKDQDRYFAQLNQLQQTYQRLEPDERTALTLAVILHDVGVSKAVPRHDEHSAQMIAPLLQRVGLSPELIALDEQVVRYHHLPGAMTLGEAPPAEFQRILGALLPEQRIRFREFLLLLSSADFAGRRSDNYLTPLGLDYYLQFTGFSTPAAQGPYVDYRLERIARANVDVPLVAAERGRLQTAVEQLVPAGEVGRFREVLDQTIVLSNAPSYLNILAAQDPSYRSLIKVLRFYAQVASVADISTFDSTLYGAPPVSRASAVAKLLTALREVPDQLTADQTHVQLERSGWTQFFGIPLNREPGFLQIDPLTLAGIEEIGPYIDKWDSYTDADKAELFRQWQALEAQSDRPLEEVARYAANPAAFAQKIVGVPVPDLTTLPQEAFSAPDMIDLPMDLSGWFVHVDSSEAPRMRDLLSNTVFVILSGGGGRRFKDGVHAIPLYESDLKNQNRLEKPTAILHVSAKSPQVRALEALESVSRQLGAKPKVIVVDSEDASEAVETDLEQNAPWLLTSPYLEARFGKTIVYPGFHKQTGKVITYRDATGKPHIFTSPNGTLGANQAAWKEIADPNLRYFIIHGDNPTLLTPPFLTEILREVSKSDHPVDLLTIATEKKSVTNPVGGTYVDVKVGDSTLHLNLQPPQRKGALVSEAESVHPGFFPFDTGYAYMSGRLLKATMEGGVPLNQSGRDIYLPDAPDTKVPALLPENYGTDVILHTNVGGMTFQVARLPLDDETASTYRATKAYVDSGGFGLQGVSASDRTLRARDRAILNKTFAAQGASDRLSVVFGAFVEISARVPAIQVTPGGALQVQEGVGIEFAFEGVRARRVLGEYSSGHPRFSTDFVTILPAQPDGIIIIDRPISIDQNTVAGLGAGLEETTTTQLRSPVTFTNVQGTLAAVVSAADVPELATLAGSTRPIGNAWLVVLPAAAGAEVVASQLVPFMEKPDVTFITYGSPDHLVTFTAAVGTLFPVEGPIALTDRSALGVLRRIFANLSGLEEKSVTDEALQGVARDLGLGVQL